MARFRAVKARLWTLIALAVSLADAGRHLAGRLALPRPQQPVDLPRAGRPLSLERLVLALAPTTCQPGRSLLRCELTGPGGESRLASDLNVHRGVHNLNIHRDAQRDRRLPQAPRTARVATGRALVSLLVLVSLLAAFLHVHVTGAPQTDGSIAVAAAVQGAAEGATCILCAFVGGGVLATALAMLTLNRGACLARLERNGRFDCHVILDVCARGPPSLLAV